MAPKPDADPYARAPDYPDDAEYFVFQSGNYATSVSATVAHAADDLDADEKPDQIEEVRRKIPEHAARTSRPDEFTFETGDPIPELFVHDHVWKVNHRRLVPLDGDGQPLDDGRPETEAEKTAKRAAAKIAADRGEQPADPEPESPTDGEGGAADPLADVTVDEVADMDYHALRGLTAAIPGVSGNASRDEIEAALVDELRERDDGADAEQEAGAA